MGSIVTRVCQIFLAGSISTSLIFEDEEVCRMCNSLCWDSGTSSRGISKPSATRLKSSWNCLKSSVAVGGGGIMASFGEEEELL